MGINDCFDVGMVDKNKEKLGNSQIVKRGLRGEAKKVSLKGLVEIPIKVDMEIAHSGESKEDGCSKSDGYGGWPLIATKGI